MSSSAGGGITMGPHPVGHGLGCFRDFALGHSKPVNVGFLRVAHGASLHHAPCGSGARRGWLQVDVVVQFARRRL